MDFRWIEDFLALSKLRNFTEAARARNVSQPAFSRRIKSLELWVGTELIDRKAYPIKLTPAGEHFMFSAEEIATKIAKLQQECRNHSSHSKSHLAY